MKEYNILNGDCLKELLNKDYSNLLVMREALIQGPIEDLDLKIFFKKRAIFISEEYKACKKEDYLQGLKEFDKIKNIEKDCPINLWFGKDLFCQVNFWFLLNFLKEKISTNQFFLVLPKEEQNCSFSNKQQRAQAFKEKLPINKTEYEVFCTLWRLFQKKQYSKMEEQINSLQTKYPFLKETIKAINDLEKTENEIKKLYEKEKSFETLFQKVSKEYSIYGYGDLQIKYLLKD